MNLQKLNCNCHNQYKGRDKINCDVAMRLRVKILFCPPACFNFVEDDSAAAGRAPPPPRPLPAGCDVICLPVV